MMSFTTAVAWADALGRLALVSGTEPCRQWATGIRCTEGPYEITVRARPIREGSTEASARVGRFLQLLDWPSCRFEPAWLDGERGHQAVCTNGEHAWIGRWWVIDGVVLTQVVTGPAPGLAPVAERWFPRVGFAAGEVRAPRPRLP